MVLVSKEGSVYTFLFDPGIATRVQVDVEERAIEVLKALVKTSEEVKFDVTAKNLEILWER